MHSKPSIRLHRFSLSGHSHSVALFASLLKLPIETIEVDLLRGEHRTPAFLALNPLGQVPVLEDGPLVLSDSHAILVYLAERYGARHWRGADAPPGAVQRFLSLAAGELAFGPAVLRRHALFGGQHDLVRARALSERLCAFFEQHLAGRDFLLGPQPSIADVACHTYLAHAPVGGFALDPYPRLRAWIARIEALDGFIALADGMAHAAHA